MLDARRDKIVDSHRFTILSYHQKSIRTHGQWAIEYYATVRDAGAPTVRWQAADLASERAGHPAFDLPNGVIVINDSERGIQKELSPEVQSEGKIVSEEVQIEPAPGHLVT